MRILVIAMAILVMVGFVYLNHYQHEMMMAGMESRPPDRNLESLAEELAAVETVFVPTTEESHQAFTQAVIENPGKTIFELDVALEDLPYEIEVPNGDRTRKVFALIVFTNDDYIRLHVPFRTDSPRYVLEHVMRHPHLDYVVLNPRHEISQNVAGSTILSPSEIATLHDYLN